MPGRFRAFSRVFPRFPATHLETKFFLAVSGSVVDFRCRAFHHMMRKVTDEKFEGHSVVGVLKIDELASPSSKFHGQSFEAGDRRSNVHVTGFATVREKRHGRRRVCRFERNARHHTQRREVEKNIRVPTGDHRWGDGDLGRHDTDALHRAKPRWKLDPVAGRVGVLGHISIARI